MKKKNNINREISKVFNKPIEEILEVLEMRYGWRLFKPLDECINNLYMCTYRGAVHMNIDRYGDALFWFENNVGVYNTSSFELCIREQILINALCHKFCERLKNKEKIPSAVQSLEGYGKANTYIDFENKKLVTPFQEVMLDISSNEVIGLSKEEKKDD